MSSAWRSVILRHILKFFVVLLLFYSCKGSNSIVIENERQGTNSWWIKQSNSTPIAQGFSTKFSYGVGETVQFKINSVYVASFHLGIFRLGYYGGKGGRMLANLSIASNKQPLCMFELASRMTDCSNWRVSTEWTVPSDALSGVYVAVPVYQYPNSPGLAYGSYIPFIVRQPKGKIGSDLLFKTADLTWVAYNKYGNWNVYRGNGSFSPDSRSFKASYDRPWQNRFLPPEGQNSNFLFGSEFAMLYWLEKQGYDVSYASCQDVEDMHAASVLVPSTTTNDAQSPSPFKILLSVGHDEYWTPALKTAYEAARENGVHLAFFSGNEVYWRVLWNEKTHAARHNLQWNDARPHAGNFFNKSVLLNHITQQVNTLHDRRVLVCRKETVNNTASITPEDWTGTFRDPRHRAPEEESLLTGQWFMVNAHRKDALEVTRDDATLRFWRNATFVVGVCETMNCTHMASAKASKKSMQTGDVVHTTPHGVLGYEWDVFPIDARPTGLFPLSTTRMHVDKHLVQNYGAQYKGSGHVTHRLSLYRHISSAGAARSHLSPTKRTQGELLQSVCGLKGSATKPTAPPKSALVFGAGTIQWSWALTAWHDGPTMKEDRDLQQATLNLFADMGVVPTSLSNGLSTDAPLVMPVSSTDITAPTSSIMHAEFKSGSATGHGVHGGHNLNKELPAKPSEPASADKSKAHARVVLRLRGRAEDVGGSVSAVEVTVNGGKTWHLANGRKRWYYVHYFAEVSNTTDARSSTVDRASLDVSALLREEMVRDLHLYELGGGYYNISMLVMSRAVDDSGWVEDSRANTARALCLLGRESHQSKSANITVRNEFIRESVRVSPSAIVLKLR